MITRIVLNNVCQTGEKIIEPSLAVNVIEGPNGCGKSSMLKGIRAGLTIAPRGTDFRGLLADGEVNGSIMLTLNRDIRISRDLSLAGSPLAVESKALGRLGNAAANKYVANTFDATAISCEAFLTKDPKERARLILEAIPFDMDKKALSDIVEDDCTHYEGHPLEIIDVVRKRVYDARTEINRSAKDRRAMAEQLSKTIQSKVDLKVIDSEIEASEAELAALEQERNEKIERAEIEAAAAVRRVTDFNSKNVNDAVEKHTAITRAKREETQAEIDALNSELNEFISSQDLSLQTLKNGARDILNDTRATSNKIVEDVRSEADAIFGDKSTAIKLSIQAARAIRDGEVAAEVQRKIMVDGIQSAARLEDQSKELSNKLDAIDEFKGNMLKELPIPGISMEDGQIFIDGKPEDQVPDSRRVKLAIDLGIARSHESSILIIDKAESLDNDSFENVIIPHLRRSGRQCFVARASVGTESDPIDGLRIRKLEAL